MRKLYFISLSTWYDKSLSSSQYLRIHPISCDECSSVVFVSLSLLACTNRISIQSSKLKWCYWCICDISPIYYIPIQNVFLELLLSLFAEKFVAIALEVHCLVKYLDVIMLIYVYSEEGLYIFRELYGQLGKTRTLILFSIPFLCLTVTAAQSIQMKDFQ